MNELKELIAKRKHAYVFIKTLFVDMGWADTNLATLSVLADVVDVQFNDLKLLSEGKIDPMPRLVEQVRNFFEDPTDPRLAEQIERNLVEPFFKPRS